uniref:AMP-dependent synthetase/ligase domain-containing protein n=1 Tax=Bionectria ochroleuca TaxID=29856 RepID=A0A8H7N5B3_BIOOC
MGDLPGFIEEYNVDWAWLTPSLVQTLSPEKVPSLKVIVLGGEAVTQDILNRWFGKLRLINLWGPGEVVVASTWYEYSSINDIPTNIGRPLCGYTWVVDPQDCTKLAPIGTVGEIIIQTPTMLREYLNNDEQTHDAVISALPDWAPKHSDSSWNRFYKTGDLASYNEDGTINFISRKDTQVKIRGLRVELGEIEFHIRELLEGVQQVAVDVLKTDIGVHLVAYFCYNDKMRSNHQDDVFLPLNAKLHDAILKLTGSLHLVLPSYEVPTIFIPCSYMPGNTSDKLDREGIEELHLESGPGNDS